MVLRKIGFGCVLFVCVISEGKWLVNFLDIGSGKWMMGRLDFDVG